MLTQPSPKQIEFIESLKQQGVQRAFNAVRVAAQSWRIQFAKEALIGCQKAFAANLLPIPTYSKDASIQIDALSGAISLDAKLGVPSILDDGQLKRFSVIKRLGLDSFMGCLNPRPTRDLSAYEAEYGPFAEMSFTQKLMLGECSLGDFYNSLMNLA